MSPERDCLCLFKTRLVALKTRSVMAELAGISNNDLAIEDNSGKTNECLINHCINISLFENGNFICL